MVELGKSKVPLEEDLIKKPIEFVKSWVEWAADNEEQVVRSGVSLTGIVTIFTVPDKKTLYVTSAFLSHVFDGNAVTGTSGSLTLSTVGSILRIRIILGTVSFGSLAVSFPMPLKLQSGQAITITGGDAGGTGAASGGFTGFLIPKRIS